MICWARWAAVRAEQLLAERQRELQQVAGLTAEEAREFLLKQIEADARRDAANLVKRLETEAVSYTHLTLPTILRV